MTERFEIFIPGARKLTSVILCGGRGERLKPLTNTTPKPLLPVNGRPLLDYLLDHLRSCGVEDTLLCVGYKAALFEDFIKDRQEHGEQIRCLNYPDATITQRIAHARKYVPDRALVCYADTLADVKIDDLTKAHEASKAEATLTVYPYHSPFGIVSFDQNGFAASFEEKPRLPFWINIGFLMLEQAAIGRLDPERSFPSFLSEMAESRNLNAFRHLGRHWTANTENELRQLAAELKNHWGKTLLNETSRM